MNIEDGKLISENDLGCKVYEFNDCDMESFEITEKDIGREFLVAYRDRDSEGYFVSTLGIRSGKKTVIDIDEEDGEVTVTDSSGAEFKLNKNGKGSDIISRGNGWCDFGCWISSPLSSKVIWAIKLQRIKISKLKKTNELLLDKAQELQNKAYDMEIKYLTLERDTLKKEINEQAIKDKIHEFILELDDNDRALLMNNIGDLVARISEDED